MYVQKFRWEFDGDGGMRVLGGCDDIVGGSLGREEICSILQCNTTGGNNSGRVLQE